MAPRAFRSPPRRLRSVDEKQLCHRLPAAFVASILADFHAGRCAARSACSRLEINRSQLSSRRHRWLSDPAACSPMNSPAGLISAPRGAAWCRAHLPALAAPAPKPGPKPRRTTGLIPDQAWQLARDENKLQAPARAAHHALRSALRHPPPAPLLAVTTPSSSPAAAGAHRSHTPQIQHQHPPPRAPVPGHPSSTSASRLRRAPHPRSLLPLKITVRFCSNIFSSFAQRSTGG